MARTFRRHRSVAPIAELNVTNLIDVAFTLLIVFMIATPLIQQEQTIPVNLPFEAISPQAKPDPKQRTEFITIQANGGVLLGTRPLSLRQLSTELARFAEESSPPVIRLRFDANATAQHFTTVLEELKRHKLTKISFDTQTPR